MLINGTDLTGFGATVKQWTVEPGMRELKNDSEWERGSPLPIFQTPSATFKDLTITLMVYGSSRDDIMIRISDILASLTGETELELDGWSHLFCGILENSSVKEVSETSRNRFLKLELKFTGYEHGEEVEVSVEGVTSGDDGTQTITVTNPGNVISPSTIELTPTIGMSSLVLNGLCRDSETGEDLEVTVSTLTTGNTVVLDGMTGLITENGELKAGDVDMWALPTLLPGSNTITLSSKYVSAVVKVLPIYM